MRTVGWMWHPLSFLHFADMSFWHSCQVRLVYGLYSWTNITNYQINFDINIDLEFDMNATWCETPKLKNDWLCSNSFFRQWIENKNIRLHIAIEKRNYSVLQWCQAINTREGQCVTACVTAAHFACTTALDVPSLLRFTHSSSTLNESANHPMHWTSQTILYLSMGYRRENNDSLTQVKRVMWLNQYCHSGTLNLNPLFNSMRFHFLCLFSSLSLKIIIDMSNRVTFHSVLYSQSP